MAYVKKTLAPGEEYLYRARFNWTYDFGSWFWLAFGAIPFGIWLTVVVRDSFRISNTDTVFTAFTFGALGIGALILLTRYVHKWTTVIAVTTVRLILKKGLVARDTHEVSLDKIEEVLVHQSFIGRILGFGKLTIRGTGIAVIEFPILARPTEIRREIETAVVRARELVKSSKP